MPRLSAQDKKADLLRRQQEIANQLRQLNAREKDAERKADTRRKVIAGALALEHFTKNPNSEFGKTLFRLLDEYVDSRGRALFPFLPELNDTTSDQSAPVSEDDGHQGIST